MSAQEQNNNNTRDIPEMKNSRNYAGDMSALSSMKKSKKKKRLGLFSFRSKRTKTVKSVAANPADHSDSVSGCSEISITEDHMLAIEGDWTEKQVYLLGNSYNQMTQENHAPSTPNDQLDDGVNQDSGISRTSEGNSNLTEVGSNDGITLNTNEEDSTITTVTPISEDSSSLATEKEEISPNSIYLKDEKVEEDKDTGLIFEIENQSKSEGSSPRQLYNQIRPSSIQLKSSGLDHRQADQLLPDFVKSHQHMFADHNSSSTECSSYQVSPVRKNKQSKKGKMYNNSTATHQIKVRLLSGENLAARDSNGLSDPYVKFKIGRTTLYKSSKCKATLNPRWGEEFSSLVKNTDELLVRVFDYDLGRRDDFMGASSVELQQLSEDEEVELSLPLDDPDAEGEELGFIHLAITLVPIMDDVDSNWNRTESKLSLDDMGGDSISIASSRILNDRFQLSRSDSNASDVSRRTAASVTVDAKNRKMLKVAVATATVQLVSGKGLPARDSNGLSDPYVKLTMGKQRHRSKVCYKTLDPVWKEEFLFQLTNRESIDRDISPLDITVWDKDSYRKDDFIGRCEIDLWSLERDKTHYLNLNLTDAQGSILILVTLHSCKAADTPVKTNYQLNDLREKFSIWSTFSDISDIGFAEIKVLRANGCRAADIGGKSDPFCVVELCNARAQTHTCFKTLDPVWDKTVNFPIKDIHDVLHFNVFDEDKDGEPDFLGRVAIPLLRVKNGETRTYVLKDRKLLDRSKGTITLQISLLFNPARAAIRTFNPREENLMRQEPRFKRQLLLRNFHRVWNCIQAVLQTLEFVNSCFTWENPVRSATAFIVYILVVWNIELYMLPILLLLLLLKNYFSIVRKTKVDRRMPEHPDDSYMDDDEDEGEDASSKLSLMQRLNALQEVLLKVQNILDWIASLLERIHNTFTWTVPFLSTLAVIVLLIICLILYCISFRTIAILWGINKFTKRLRKPNYIPNNELLDFLSRIPSEVELDEFQELSMTQGSPKSRKKKR